jgi:hypothetical protein
MHTRLLAGTLSQILCTFVFAIFAYIVSAQTLNDVYAVQPIPFVSSIFDLFEFLYNNSNMRFYRIIVVDLSSISMIACFHSLLEMCRQDLGSVRMFV